MCCIAAMRSCRVAHFNCRNRIKVFDREPRLDYPLSLLIKVIPSSLLRQGERHPYMTKRYQVFPSPSITSAGMNWGWVNTTLSVIEFCQKSQTPPLNPTSSTLIQLSKPSLLQMSSAWLPETSICRSPRTSGLWEHTKSLVALRKALEAAPWQFNVMHFVSI